MGIPLCQERLPQARSHSRSLFARSHLLSSTSCPQELAEDIAALRTLPAEMDRAVALAYGWGDLGLGHGFHQTKQGRASPSARRRWPEALGRRLSLNHPRYEDEVRQGLHDKSGKGKKGRAARGSSADDERQEATARAPTLFDEDV